MFNFDFYIILFSYVCVSFTISKFRVQKSNFFLSLFSCSLSAFTQTFIETKPEVYKKLNISGSYRFFVQHRHFINPYITGVNGLDTIN